MDQQQIIAQLEARAKALGVSIGQVCEDAGVHPTTFSRWKLSERNPDPVGATMRSLSKLDDALKVREHNLPQGAAA
jgi:hypothetical protein